MRNSYALPAGLKNEISTQNASSIMMIKRIPFLFSSLLLFLVMGISGLGFGQSKTINGDPAALKKEFRVERAFLQSDKVETGNQVPETTVIHEDASESNAIPEPIVDAPVAARTASVTGPWNASATWGGQSVPVAGDAVTINSGITVTVTAAAACASIATVNTGGITINGTNSLTVSGLVSMARPSSNNTNFTISVGAGSALFGSLTMSATTTTKNNIISITTGTATVSGTLTTGTTGCRFIFTGAGTLNLNGTRSNSPTIVAVSGSTVNIGVGTLSATQFTAMTLPTGSNLNYSGAAAQTVYATTYLGNLGFSGAGTKTIAASTTVTVNGNITNSSSLVLTAGTSTTSTWLVMGGNVTNSGTITATADYIRFIFSSTNAQTFTNNGTVTSPVSSFDVSNTNVSGLTLAGSNSFVVARANLFTGTVYNSSMITLGAGGATTAVVQRGVAANTTPAGSFIATPGFNLGSGGLILLYDNGSVAYNTGYEVPGSLTCDLFYVFDAADVTLNSDLTISEELNFYGGTGTPILRIGAYTLTLGGTITYTVPGLFYGGATSNLVLNGSTTLNTITNGLHDLTINGNNTLGGAVSVGGALTLTNGIFSNGVYLTLADNATISRTSTGTLSDAPSFGTSVNLIYTGSATVNTGFEIPTSATVLSNLATNTGGVVQSAISSGGTVSTLYTQGFNAAPADWTTEIITNPAGTAPAITYVASAASVYPTVTFTEGGNGVQFNSYSCEAGDQIRLKKNSSPIVTTGKTNITVVFDWYVDPAYSTSNDYVTVQWSLNGTTWNPSTSYYRYNATASWVTQNCVLPSGAENQTTLYVAFLFTSVYGNNCHLDNMKVNVTTPGAPIPTTATVNGLFDLTAGTYSIGANNTLVLNDGKAGNNAIIGGTTSNLTVGGTSANLTLPTITNGLNNFTINRPNGVSIASTKTLTVSGTLTNNAGTAGLVIKSDATGTGSLIQNTANVNATIERYIEAAIWGTWDDGWHFLSSPVTNQEINTGGFVTSGAGNGYDFYLYNEPTNLWVSIDNTLYFSQLNTGTKFVPGRGYMVAYEQTATKTFAGTLNVGDVGPISGLNISGGTNHSWHLLGNPYPCALTWYTGWSTDQLGSTCAIWNESLQDYSSVVSGWVIPAMNGFMVEATGNGASLTIPASAKTHSSTAWYKNKSAENMIKLTAWAQDKQSGKESYIVLDPLSSVNFDPEFDGHYLGGYGPKFYSLAGEDELSVNTLPELADDTQIPFVFAKNDAGNFSIELDVNDLNPNLAIYLKDFKEGTDTELTKYPVYTFSSSEGDDINRFLLHFQNLNTTITDPAETNNFTTYANNGVITILQTGNHSGKVTVTDMAGRSVATAGLNAGSPTRIDMRGHTGVYLVSVLTTNGIRNTKIIVK